MVNKSKIILILGLLMVISGSSTAIYSQARYSQERYQVDQRITDLENTEDRSSQKLSDMTERVIRLESQIGSLNKSFELPIGHRIWHYHVIRTGASQ
jgi:cell division protein FtsL